MASTLSYVVVEKTTIGPTLPASPSLTGDPSQDPNQGQDPFGNGPSVYLYGFLATLVLIFLVSIGVAWKGYRARRMLRARIDEAIARGAFIPGYDPSNPNLPLFPPSTWASNLRDAPAPKRPIMYETWIETREKIEAVWDVKPTYLDALKPYDPTPPQPNPAPNTHSFGSGVLDTLRHYWFVQPPEGTNAHQLSGRPARDNDQSGRNGRRTQWRGGRRGRAEEPLRWEEEQQGEEPQRQPPRAGEDDSPELSDVSDVVASVLIVMPDRTHPHYRYIPRPGPYAASGSRPGSWPQQRQPPPPPPPPPQGVASGSRPMSWAPTPVAAAYAPFYPSFHPLPAVRAGGGVLVAGREAEEERREELPELVLGLVQLRVQEEPASMLPEEEAKARDNGEEQAQWREKRDDWPSLEGVGGKGEESMEKGKRPELISFMPSF